MKTAFICTGNTFTPSMLYKDNYFIKASVNSGYETLVIATQYIYKDGKRCEAPAGESYINGYRLVRVPYKKVLGNERITEKIRNSTDLTDLLISFEPDFVFYNCPQIYNITELKRLKKAVPNTRIVLDFSTKYINSAKNPLSKYVLHRGIYRRWLHKAQPFVDCITYVSPETLDFILAEYKLNKDKMIEVGLPAEIISESTKIHNRESIRKEYNLKDDDILFVHSGKIGKLKRTVELLQSFSKYDSPHFKMIIAGSLEDEVRDVILKLIENDKRVKYIGFVTGEYLTKLLCACDMYLQPGTISQTSQTAICCGSPIMFMNCPTNEELFNGNGFLLDGIDQMDSVFETIKADPSRLDIMKEKSMLLAKERLEYKKLFMDTLKAAGINEDNS